jgi:hypothetical protein
MSEHAPPRISPLVDEEAATYRGLSLLAVLGLLLAILSPLALVGTVLWLLPLAAVVLCALALRQIAAQAPHLVGRKAALAGLLLGLVCLVAAPTEESVYRYFIRREAREYAANWIEAVRHQQVYAAHNLMLDARHRAPPDARLADYYSRTDFVKRVLPQFIDQPLMRTLFALGASAEYRYYETVAEGDQPGGDFVNATYAVTRIDEQRRKETFFITLPMGRTVDAKSGRCTWTMGTVEGPVRPSGW